MLNNFFLSGSYFASPFVGYGVFRLGIGSAALGGAKIIKTLPPSSRAPALITIASMATAYKSAVDRMEFIYKYGNASSNTDSSRDKDSIISKNISLPKDYSIDSTLKFDDYSIKVKVENDTLTLIINYRTWTYIYSFRSFRKMKIVILKEFLKILKK